MQINLKVDGGRYSWLVFFFVHLCVVVIIRKVEQLEWKVCVQEPRLVWMMKPQERFAPPTHTRTMERFCKTSSGCKRDHMLIHMRNPSISITQNHIIPFSPYHHNPNECFGSQNATQTWKCHEMLQHSEGAPATWQTTRKSLNFEVTVKFFPSSPDPAKLSFSELK